MPKNRFGGNKSKKLKNLKETIDISRIPTDISNSGEPKKMYAQVKKLFGDNRLEVLCNDLEMRHAVIPGSMRKRDWISMNDILLVQFRQCESDKKICDVLYKYNKMETKQLKNLGNLTFITDEHINNEEENKNNEDFDFNDI